MPIYHVTSRFKISSILADGFIDPHGGRYVDAGVWFADQPLVDDVMFEGDQRPLGCVSLEVPEDRIAEFEQEMPDGSDHREWKVPHEVANEFIASAMQIEFHPEGFVEEYEGYWIIKTTEVQDGAALGRAVVRIPVSTYSAFDPDSNKIIAQHRLLIELKLLIHNELP